MNADADVDAPPTGDWPWFVSLPTSGPSPDARDEQDDQGGEYDRRPGESQSRFDVPGGTVLAWSHWAHEGEVPSQLERAMARLAQRMAGDLPTLSYRNPEGEKQFDHDDLVATLGDALGTVVKLCRANQIVNDDLAEALHATHNGAIVAAIASEATGEEALWQAGHWLTRAGEELHQAMWRRFQPLGDGRYRLRLRRGERSLLARAFTEQRQRLLDDSPELSRLFPPGYGDSDDETTARSDEFSSLTRDDLMAGRLDALASVEATLDQKVIDSDALSAWMRTLNDIRLVLGTQLDITDDEQPPPAPWDSTFPTWRVYALLGALVYEAVSALRSEL